MEEIWDLQSESLVEGGDVYGFIFLFRWIEDRRARRKLIEEENLYVKNNVKSLFFAQQVWFLRTMSEQCGFLVLVLAPRTSLGRQPCQKPIISQS